jgi:hypothetical protein
MNTHFYEHIYTHSTPMTTSEKLSWLDFEIYEISHQECLVVEEDVDYHQKNN